MPWWGYLIIAISLLVLSVISSICAGNKAFDNNLRARIKSGEEVYCLYNVIDKATGKRLFFGCKYRAFESTVLVGEDKKFFEKIYTYQKDDVICGRECEITFWVGYDPKDKSECFIVDEEGRRMIESYTQMGDIFNA